MYYFEDIEKGDYDCVVTYGSGQSNHCRIVANLAASMQMECKIISPEEDYKETFNSKIFSICGAETVFSPLSEVSKTIENTLSKLKNKNRNPYFIMGGGHGNLGTQAYVDCYSEISEYENKNNLVFDYIFLASGTGTTQSGLVCGQKLQKHQNRKIVGISIARNKDKGVPIILGGINDYMSEMGKHENINNDDIIFIDDYILGGYGKYNETITDVIKKLIITSGIPFDTTYTGKAFNGMLRYLADHFIKNKNILFLHTGGTPLFFDDLAKF